MDANVRNQNDLHHSQEETSSPIRINSFEKTFQGLNSCLDELTVLYRNISELLKVEKKFLISSGVDEILKVNSEKEQILKKIAGVEGLRLGFAGSLARELKLTTPTPRLLEIADALKGTAEERQLKKHYDVISKLIEQVQELNQENETLAMAALKNIGGALENIKDTLTGKKTYHKSGQYKSGPEKSGNFISKEA